MNSHDWPIRTKLTALVVVPVAALLALWIFATTLALGPALDLLAARTLLRDLGLPGDRVVVELQRERRLSVVHLAGPGEVTGLSEQRQRTDEAVAELRSRAGGRDLRDAADDLVDARLDRLFTALEALPAGRRYIDRRQVDRTGAHGLYTDMLDTLFQTYSAMATGPDVDLTRQARAISTLGQARELLGQADSLAAGAFTAGRFARGEHAALVQTIGNQRYVTAVAVDDLPAATHTAFQRLTEGADFLRLRRMQDELVAADPGDPPSVDARTWQTTHDVVQRQLRDFELAEAEALTERSVPAALGILGRLAAAGLLGLVAVVVSLVVALRVGRSLVRRLTGVRTAATELAERRLPDVVARLRRGAEVDVAREAPLLEFGTDEIGQVGQAFAAVQRTAVQSAVDEAALRHGLNQVFLNIARRTQGLVHRQLALLDRMERRTEDPEELAELFGVDHLATRMRRHAEALVILAGAAPGRGWRNPVAVLDVVRGAISEVEAYDRVDIAPVRPAAVVGRAVGDVIHLLAELIENATAFSSPESRVRVHGEMLPNGYAVEISDRGLGMTADAIEEANRRLARSPEFDPATSARLGHFVVARLAARHGVRVRLTAGAQGGTTAVVLLPPDLMTTEPPRPTVDRSGDRMAKVTKLSTLPRPRSIRSARRRPEPPSVVPLTAARSGPAEIPVGPDGLPRRVRQRGPARQSRRPVPVEPSPRTPEQVRAAMAALQSGTARGRRAGAYPAESTPAPSAVDGPAAGPSATGAGPVDAPTVPAAPAVPAEATADQPTTELPRVRPGGASVETVTGRGRDG
ncbi:ATP-binding protein [Micromonospora echinospora]|uniref:histidine kinase n=1 Tax=Micromonospora echinospora TaxID=1877 RepID=A0A1C4XRA0_MICEC|nr:nitrate- and nitrite sensing domain-containing protein [Micromonospora echinospora]OZV78541.1 ATP-binding protein [Micromonospora echinospora]SCF11025.1 Signal transduction histidine kinase [Micromonospora echinospora]